MQDDRAGWNVRSLSIPAALLLIVMIILTSACTNQERSIQNEPPDNILIKDNEDDFERIEQFVSRFEEGKPDYLMLIPPILDGGYWIYDLHSDGNKVSIRIDTTRDGQSDRINIRVSCKDISIETDHTEERGIRKVLEAHHCDGDQTVAKFQITSLEVE